jgi:N-acetylglucosaminyldiphosphoundecaprenol N-acetyl-beta-D-mannosaminyltransferase
MSNNVTHRKNRDMASSVAVLGYPIHTDTQAALLIRLDTALAQGGHPHVVTLNPEMLMAGDADPDFGEILKTADVVLPDGAGIVWALRRKGYAVKRIPGIEFAENLLEDAARTGQPVALIGASPEVNQAAQSALLNRFTGLKIAYAHHGFFESETEHALVARQCANTQPRYVFVALGVPRQEQWIRQYRSWFQQPTVFVGVGGSFDIWSGLKKRAPAVFRQLHLEWLYRISSEPWRIRRVAFTLPMFVVKIIMYDRER